MPLIPRVIFYPTLAYGVFMEKMLQRRHWYDRIDETVILGALPFRSVTQKILDENVRAVINMTESYETRFWVTSPAEWAERGVEYLSLSTPDIIAAPTQVDLYRGVQFIMKHRLLGNTVYVHCKAGRTRSTTVVACYLMTLHNWDAHRAVEFIRDKRPHIRIRMKQWLALKAFYRNNVVKATLSR